MPVAQEPPSEPNRDVDHSEYAVERDLRVFARRELTVEDVLEPDETFIFGVLGVGGTHGEGRRRFSRVSAC